jgi:hypothetical protein
MNNVLYSLISLTFLLISGSSFALNSEVKVWDELSVESVEMVSVMLGAADQLAQSKKSGELFIEMAERRVANPTTDVYRIQGIVLSEDGLVENNFSLAITRVKKEAGVARNYMYGVLYKEKRID